MVFSRIEGFIKEEQYKIQNKKALLKDEKNSIPEKNNQLYEMMMDEKRQIFSEYIEKAIHDKSETILMNKENENDAKLMLNNEYKERRLNNYITLLESTHTCTAVSIYNGKTLFAANNVHPNLKGNSDKFEEEIKKTTNEIFDNKLSQVTLK